MSRVTNIAKALLVGCLMAYPGYASATVFNFDITYNGVFQSLDSGSDVPTASPLIAGQDGFILDLHTHNSSYWEVTNPNGWNIIYAAFSVSPGNNRTYNSTATFLMDGVVVHTDIDVGAMQGGVHVGAQVTTMPFAGLMFDQLIVDWTFVAGLNTTITNDLLVFNFLGNSNAANFVVPEPGTLAILGLGLVGLGLARRRKAA